MKRFMTSGCLFSVLTLFCGAQKLYSQENGWFLNPSFFYQSSEFSFQPTWTGSGSSEEWLRINASAGLATSGGFILGLKYFDDKKVSRSENSGNEVTEQVTAAGPGFGFRFGELAIFVSIMALKAPVYHHSASRRTLSGGDGTIVDLMYFADMGGWYLGPQLTWRSFQYKTLEDKTDPDSQAVRSFTRAEEIRTEPYISIFILL